MRVVALDDSKDSLNDTGGSATTDTPSSSSVPLKYEKRLQRMKDLAKQMPDSQSLHQFNAMRASTFSLKRALTALNVCHILCTYQNILYMYYISVHVFWHTCKFSVYVYTYLCIYWLFVLQSGCCPMLAWTPHPQVSHKLCTIANWP